jgi:hypothetical protein
MNLASKLSLARVDVSDVKKDSKKRNKEVRRKMYKAVEYSGAKHKFAVKGDRADPLQKERGEKSKD